MRASVYQFGIRSPPSSLTTKVPNRSFMSTREAQRWKDAFSSSIYNRSSAPTTSVASLAVPHPASGASAAEAAAWEAALCAGGSKSSSLVAAIECGSHSTRLLIVDAANGAEVLGATHDPCLGAELASGGDSGDGTSGGGGNDSGGSSTAGQATLDALRGYAAELSARGVARVRAVGTAALRAAPAAARERFLAEARRALGDRCAVEVLTGDEEGALAFKGATSGAAEPRGSIAGRAAVVIDLGGRSTEIAFGFVGGGDGSGSASGSAVDVVSLPLGCLSLLASTSGTSSSSSSSSFDMRRQTWAAAATRVLEQSKEAAALRARAAAATASSGGRAPLLFATGGTATTAAALDLRLPEYDGDVVHGRELTCRDLDTITYRLSCAQAQRDFTATHPWLTRERAASVAPGAAALAAVVRWWRAGDGGGGGGGDERASFVVSNRDLLDGIVLGLMADVSSSSASLKN